jgi:hypothetical protein
MLKAGTIMPEMHDAARDPSTRMLWPEMDAAFPTSGGNGGGVPAAARWPVVVVAAG